jgi:hypothetical protein
LNFERKYAITRLDAPIVTLQVELVPLHEAPPQPANTEVASGVGVRVIICPSETPGGVQSDKQENSGAATLPPPGPPKNIESVAGTSGLMPPGSGLLSSGGPITTSPGDRIGQAGPYWNFQRHVVVVVLVLGARKKPPLPIVGGGLLLPSMQVLMGSADGIVGKSISWTVP